MGVVDYEESTSSDSDDVEEIQAQASSFSCVSSEFRRPEARGDPRKGPVSEENVGEEVVAPSSTSSSSLKRHFLDMGFQENMVERAIKQNGNGNADAVLETLLTYSVLDDSSIHVYSPHDPWSSENEEDEPEDEQSDVDENALDKEDEIAKEYVGTTSGMCSEEPVDNISVTDNKKSLLVDMGFPIDEISLAIGRCGENASICELADSIYASQTHQETHGSRSDCSPHFVHYSSEEDECDWELLDSNIPGYDGRTKWIGESSSCGTKRKNSADKRNSKNSPHCAYYSSEEDECYRDTMESDIPGYDGRMKRIGESSSCGRKKRYNADERNSVLKRQRGYDLDDNAVRSHLWKTSNPMTGFGLPNEPNVRRFRKLPDTVIGPPFFYYENVALTPKGVWETISRFLYDIEPEFVDSKYFSAAARKRGYIHNLPIDNRFQLQPIPPLTIQEALPYTRKWWPSWDPRKKLNCINTCCASARLTDRLRKIVSDSEGTPSYADQQIVLEQCRKWNLVWVGLHKLAPLEPDEIEPLLGFPKHHTRGGGVSRTERLRALGNSFQVDTVAYHLSVLKRMFPYGLNVLSLFSGIGGAEVALHRLGIPLKNVVSIEISEVSRNVLKNWWCETGQKGRLIEIANIEQLTSGKLESMMGAFGGFDLVIGGSPCNNLTGSNRVSRDGLEGKHSSLFYDYFRILDFVRCTMSKNR
ncbi:DNA (cytosine-5)-methyltransferase DRM2 isoform X2 [Nymphaea colorata]|uniref:DNA (cytosine-5)-methyltransferase DRM2 isoform X2 n=1 Tax=Nymphaea colorata TaxID=210225 RepID=UPI00129EC172|nr:DNA (cytosine-5)-methyltransferase DRM2 isoform X2 [Nymphaea colorata]XP_031500396.1 DNA (cytosine-5)-methyltransferase DRM2 isoform X2 [Nymphaea colorata]